MDSISPGATRIAGNHSDFSTGVRTFLGKLMDRLWLGKPALGTPYRRSDQTPARHRSSP